MIPRGRRSGWSRAAAGEGGFTIVEVAIAAIILAISGLAVLGLVDSASRNDYRAEQSQVINDRLQQEMEKIKQTPYDQVALTSLPTHSTDAANPNFRVSGSQFNVNKSGSNNNEDLVYNGASNEEVGGTVSGGTVDPGPTAFSTGNAGGNIYRYVTWETDSTCDNCGDNLYKHVVIAITLNPTAPGGTRAYQEIQGNVSNPNAGLSNCPSGVSGCTNPGGPDATPWTFWLTDTPCNFDTRQTVTADHLTHNGLGACATGMQTGATAGAPDLMYTQAAPIDNSFPPNQQPLHDYATDVEPGCGSVNCNTQDPGLQETAPSANGCLLNTGQASSPLNNALEMPSSDTNARFEVHKWLSPKIPANFSDVVLDGSGELDLWTQTISGAVQQGKICVWLFTNHLDGSNNPVEVPATATTGNAYFTYSQFNWPNGAWTEIHLPLNFSQVTLQAGYRLGLAIGVERAGTCPPQGSCSGVGLQYIYDSPSYDSRVEVDTHSLVPTF